MANYVKHKEFGTVFISNKYIDKYMAEGKIDHLTRITEEEAMEILGKTPKAQKVETATVAPSTAKKLDKAIEKKKESKPVVKKKATAKKKGK